MFVGRGHLTMYKPLVNKWVVNVDGLVLQLQQEISQSVMTRAYMRSGIMLILTKTYSGFVLTRLRTRSSSLRDLSLQALPLLEGTRFIAWRQRHPFFRGMLTGHKAFLCSSGVSGLRPGTLTLLKKGLMLHSSGRWDVRQIPKRIASFVVTRYIFCIKNPSTRWQDGYPNFYRNTWYHITMWKIPTSVKNKLTQKCNNDCINGCNSLISMA